MPKLMVDGSEVDVNVGPEGAQFTMGQSTVKVDGEGNLVGAQAFGNTLERVEDGMIITRANGAKVKIADNGEITLLTPPKAVGIRDLAKVANYTIRVEGDNSVHTVTFADGGHAQITFHQGQFASLSGHHIQQSMNEENEMLIAQFNEDQPAQEA